MSSLSVVHHCFTIIPRINIDFRHNLVCPVPRLSPISTHAAAFANEAALEFSLDLLLVGSIAW